jgi:hypothetical protein
MAGIFMPKTPNIKNIQENASKIIDMKENFPTIITIICDSLG